MPRATGQPSRPAKPARVIVFTLGEWRLRAGWTLTDLAQASGVDRQTIHRIERGVTVPRPPTRRALAHALRVKVADIVWPVASITQEVPTHGPARTARPQPGRSSLR